MPTKTPTARLERRAQQDQRKRREALKVLRLPPDLRHQVEAAIVEAQCQADARR